MRIILGDGMAGPRRRGLRRASAAGRIARGLSHGCLGKPMHAHIVLAHPESQSFNAHLARVARRSLEAQGWTVTLSDLYAMGFDPSERAEHYLERRDAA